MSMMSAPQQLGNRKRSGSGLGLGDRTTSKQLQTIKVSLNSTSRRSKEAKPSPSGAVGRSSSTSSFQGPELSLTEQRGNLLTGRVR